MQKLPSERAAAGATMVLAALFLLVVYVPDIGHGFLKDDFTWVAAAARLDAHPWTAFLSDFTGTFYRPVITLTFAADHALYGLAPFGYGVTNLLLLTGCAVVLARLLRALGCSGPAAVSAAGVWMVNPHGINMSLLWLSGRTSLVMALLSCAATLAFVRGAAAARTAPVWLAAGALLLLGAMLSKEDAVLVPFIALACLQTRGAPRTRLIASAALMCLVVGAYAALRWPSHALTSANAPDFYRLTWNPQQIAGNALGYLDRSATVFAVALLVAALAHGQRPRLSAGHRRSLWLAAIWFAAALAITVRVPVRSSLYAVFPSMGAALAFATVFDSLRGGSRPARGQMAVVGLLLVAVLAAPLYRQRNQRWVRSAAVSQQTVRALESARDGLPDSGRIVFQDEAVRFANFADALGDAATDAVRLVTGRRLEAVIVREASPSPGEVARFVLQQGEVRRTTAGRESLRQ